LKDWRTESVKSLAVFIGLTLLMGCVTDYGGTMPGQRIGYIQKNPIYCDRHDVYRPDGLRSGIYLEPNSIYKGQMNLKSTGKVIKGTAPPKGGSSFRSGKSR
jgi:hypothetical protein